MALDTPDLSRGMWANLFGATRNVSAYSDVQRSNVTGDATEYTLQFNAEYADSDGAFNTSNYTYTAVSTGKYLVTVRACFSSVASGHTTGLLKIVTSNRTHNFHFNPYNRANAAGVATLDAVAVVDLDAADTLSVTATISGGSKVIEFEGATATGPTVSTLEIVRVA